MEKMKSPIELSFSVEMSLFLWLFRHGKAFEFQWVRSYKWRINAMEETFLSLILKNVVLLADMLAKQWTCVWKLWRILYSREADSCAELSPSGEIKGPQSPEEGPQEHHIIQTLQSYPSISTSHCRLYLFFRIKILIFDELSICQNFQMSQRKMSLGRRSYKDELYFMKSLALVRESFLGGFWNIFWQFSWSEIWYIAGEFWFY